jgi:hypothetical protein
MPARLAIYVLGTLLVMGMACFLGEDLAWDTLHYHLYAGFSALHDRFAQDYFAAGPQAYFNPYAYAPFYAMVRAGLSPLTVSCLLALAQSTILWVTYELGVCACPSGVPRVRLLCGASAAALAFLNPVLLYQVGSSYADLTTAVPALLGWLLLVRAVRDPRAALVIGAGLLLGSATALKMTNAMHAMAAATMLIMVPRAAAARVRYGLAYGASLAVGFTLVAGPWAYRVAQQFGNPFFPLLNSVFRSPEYTTEPLRHFRFIPDNLAAALWRPFAIAQPDSMVHVEWMAPDVRYAALLLLAGLVAGRWLWQRRHGKSPAARAPSPGDTRVLMALGCGLATAWVLWLSASGNGRYFLPMACVTAALLVALLWRFFGAPTRAVLLGLLFTVQCVQLYMGSDLRDGDLAADHPWLEVRLPAKLAAEANLYLTMGVQSNSFIAPYLPAGSGLINFDGLYALSLQGANGAHIAALLRRYGPHVRVLVTGARLHRDEEQGAPQRSRVDDALARLGLRVDPTDCATITVRGVPAVYQPESRSEAREPRSKDLQLVSCAALAADPEDLARRAQMQLGVDLILDRLEDACPQLFKPRRMQTQHSGEMWLRYYANTDTMGFVNRGNVKFLGLERGGEAIYLGRESTWAKAPVPLRCGRRNDLYFAEPPRS